MEDAVFTRPGLASAAHIPFIWMKESCNILCAAALAALSSRQRQKELAERVRRRSILELKEAIALTEKFEDFERGKPSKGGDYVVHDSEGEHRISGARINPDCNQIDCNQE